jgi:putative ATPase
MKENTNKPLADLMRPNDVDEILGQKLLLGENGLVRQMINSNHLSNTILWGPPGCGKTTLARALAKLTDAEFIPMSAVFSGTNDIKKVVETAKMLKEIGKSTLLFIDEIHRFNKTQQDTLLPYLEDGTVIFIGATTENPSFNLNNALLSRCHIGVLQPLSSEDLLTLIERAEKFLGRKLPITNDAKIELAKMADGDARFLLNTVEYLANTNFKKDLDADTLPQAIAKRAPLSDKDGDEHYNCISAVHKSLRASDTDAALYWAARMIAAGQDPIYLFRRLSNFAMEDVGMADPNAIEVVLSCWETFKRMGAPEGYLAISHAIVYLGSSPKSTAAYDAWNEALVAAKKYGTLMPPKNILNAPTKMMKNLGYGEGYVYEPMTKSGFSGQNCFPDKMGRQVFYHPREVGFEREIKKRIEYWDKLRKKD